ncbi:MAG TPA: nuclear transport factor 2 family protein [Gemmatimonadales bacterium]|jgi:ketosteroid isomerase-like protein|nr:nuclear transport factor 2 family protein [Gemmatimonadales bacterium]
MDGIGHRAYHGDVNEMSSEASLLRAAERLAEAERTADIPALEGLLASDYQGFDPAGRSRSRDRVLQNYGEGGVRVTSLTQSQLQARILGDVGLVFGVNALQGHDGAEHFHFRLHFLDVWALRDGRWQLVASQQTLIPG